MVWYVYFVDKHGKSQDITVEIVEGWDLHSQDTNDVFESLISLDLDVIKLKGKMLYVWEGNRRLTPWHHHILNLHVDGKDWYISIDSICLDPTRAIGILLNATHDISW